MPALHDAQFPGGSGALPHDLTPGSAAHTNRFQNSKSAAPAGARKSKKTADNQSHREKTDV